MTANPMDRRLAARRATRAGIAEAAEFAAPRRRSRAAVERDAQMDGARIDGARIDGARTDGARTDGARTDGARTDSGRMGDVPPRRGAARGVPRETAARDTARREAAGRRTGGRDGGAESRGRARGDADRRERPADDRLYETRGSTALRPQRREEPKRAARKPGLRVAPPVPVTVPRTPFVLLVLGIVTVGIVGLLLLNTSVNAGAFRLQQMRDRQTALDTQEQELSRDLADREATGSLAAEAARLGMGPPKNSAFILPDGRTIGVPAPAGR